MAWSDKPSEAQLGAWINMTKWVIDRDEAILANRFLEKTATRKQLSQELGRLRDLTIDRKLKTREQVYEGKLWEGFDHD